MENISIKKETKFLESINKWVVGIFCPQYEAWTGGFFHRDKEKAGNLAIECLKEMIDSKRETNKEAKTENLILKY